MVLGSQWARLGAGGNSLPLQDLPQPGGTGNYAGQPASRSSFARTDAAGNLQFFGIDGSIYNGQGYRIADGAGQSCEQCIPAQYSEMLALPVPGRCDLYYIITAQAITQNSGIELLCGILDMGAPHADQSCGRGHLVGLSDFPGPYDEYGDWFPSFGDHLGHFATVGGTGELAQTLGLSAIDPHWSNGHLLLHATTDRYVHQFIVGPTEIVPSWSHEIEHDFIIEGGKEWTRDNDFGKDLITGDLLFATTDRGLEVDGEFDAYRVLVFRMNGSSGALSEVTGHVTAAAYPLGDISGGNGPYGCAFSPDGQKLYFTGDLANIDLGVVDLSTGNVTDLSSLTNLNIPSPGVWERTRLTRGKAVGGVADAIYYASADGLAALVGPNDPATAQWVDDVPFSASLSGIPAYSPPFGSPGAPTCWLMDALIAEDHHSEDLALSSETPCCAFMSDVNAECLYSFSGNIQNDPWTVADNGFLDPDNDGVIHFAQDFVVQPGASLALTGMTLRFAPTARLIIKPGGYAKFDNCTLTSYVCDGSRWPGIRVEGNTALTQSSQNQGRLLLSGCLVSNAEKGVLCATEGTSTGFGGIIYSSTTTFRNCTVGADLGDYHHSPGSLTVDNNASYFVYTRFETAAPLPDMTPLTCHLNIHNTRKVNVTHCSFANDANGLFPESQWGTGIAANQAELLVNNGTNPAYGFVRNLRYGVVRTGAPDIPITVNNMRFSGCVVGIIDAGGYLGRYTNNTFDVPDGGENLTDRRGIFLWQSRSFTVERNAFTGGPLWLGSTGIHFWGLSPIPNGQWNYAAEQIYDNTFTHLFMGTLVNGIHVSHDGFKDTQGLQLLCGDYTDNITDVGIGKKSLIKSDQGEGGGPDPQLAGNRYYHNTDPVNCAGVHDWHIDTYWNAVDPYTSMVIDYHRHEDPLCNIVCDQQVNYSGLTSLWDDPLSFSGIMDKQSDCANGVLDDTHTPQEVHGAYLEARAEAIAAKNLLDGSTDGGERPDLLADLAQDDPWLGSSYLRDELMLHSPLSDAVLDSMILRAQPMDAWHITQVLVENSPLNPRVLSVLRGSGVLDSFFENVVLQAQQGQGPSAKQLLEKELTVRLGEQARTWAQLGWLWGTDTVDTDAADSVRAQYFFAGGGLDFTQARIEQLIAEGDWSTATAKLNALSDKWSGRNALLYLLQQGAAYGGEWGQLTAAEVDSLTACAEDGAQGAALIAGILRAYGLADVLLDPIYPNAERAFQVGSTPSAQDGDAREDRIMAYPDPADDHAMITFPAEWKGRVLEVLDVRGIQVLSMTLASPGLANLNTAPLAPGPYLLRITGAEQVGRLLVKH